MCWDLRSEVCESAAGSFRVYMLEDHREMVMHVQMHLAFVHNSETQCPFEQFRC